MRRDSLVVVVCALAIPLVVLVSWLAAGHDRAEAGNGLGKEVLVHDHHHAAHGLLHALHRLDRARPRASGGMPTAIAVDAALPRVYTASEVLWL